METKEKHKIYRDFLFNRDIQDILQDTRHKTQDTRHKTQDTRYKTQDTRHKINKRQDTRFYTVYRC